MTDNAGSNPFDPQGRDPMSVAFDEARAAAARGEVPVGAVIVKDGRHRRLCRQPPAGAARPLGPCGDARHPPGLRGARRRAAVRLRSLRDAGALHHVRGRDLLRPHPAGLFRRPRSRRAARSTTACASSTSRPATTRRRSMAASGRARRRPCCGSFSKGGARAPNPSKTPAAPRASRSGSPRPRNGLRSRRSRWPWGRSSGARSRAAACGRRRGR